MARRTSLRQSIPRFSAVRRGQRSRPLGDVGGDGGCARIVNAANGSPAVAGVMIFFHFIDVDLISIYNQPVHIVVIISILGRRLQQSPDPLILLPFKICGERCPQLSRSHCAVFEHDLFQRGKTVGQIGDSHLQIADKVVDSPPFLHVQAALQTVVCQCGTQDIRRVLFQHHIAGSIANDALTAHFAYYLFPAGKHLVKPGEIPEMPHTLTEFNT